MAQTSKRLRRLRQTKRANSNALRRSNKTLKAVFQAGAQHLGTLIAVKRALNSSSPKIVWQFLVHRGNQHEIAAARRKAKSLGIEIVFEKLGIPTRFQKTWSPDAAAMRPIPSKQRRSPERTWTRAPDKWTTVCLQTWEMPVIHSDGTVLPCCVVSDSRYGLGNIFKEPFEKIWNKPLIVAMRRYLKAGTKSKLKLPCYGCPHDPNAPGRGQ